MGASLIFEVHLAKSVLMRRTRAGGLVGGFLLLLILSRKIGLLTRTRAVTQSRAACCTEM